MCGIAGIFSYDSNSRPVEHEELLRIRERMISRGPDECGEWYSADGQVGLAHRRLAIIDLSESGAQPMHSVDESLVITFNGEIYNYCELRNNLEKKGYCFRSSSDTEVLLHLYAEKGTGMLHDLRGMFAFALWDKRKKGLFIARDPFGVKPLYYADNGKTIRIASQVKALLAGGSIDTSPEPAGHVGFFLWGHVPEPYTLYKGIRALPAGSYAWLQQSPVHHQALTIRQYCSIPEELRMAEQHPLSLTGSELREYLRATLLDSVKHHLLADVPVGVFLSSGLDSTTLTALSSELVRDQLRTVTLGFLEYKGTDNDEVPLAELVAKQYGTTHTTVWVNKEEFQNEKSRLLDAMDQPSMDGINSYFVSKAAVQTGLKVAISGLGGDELFGSYPSFQQIPRLVKNVRTVASIPGLGRGFRLVTAPFIKRFTSPKYASILEFGGSFAGAYLLRRGMYMPWELPDLLDVDLVRQGWGELQTLLRLNATTEPIVGDHQKVSSLELSWYMRNQLLRDCDWASMAHSLEVRVPFVDLEVLRKLAPLFSGRIPVSKRDMAVSVGNLPDEVINRGKTGFCVPVREWMNTGVGHGGERGLRGWARKIYADEVSGLRVLVLVTDAFGGRGGIAKFNRDLLTSLCEMPQCAEVVAIPRIMPDKPEVMPQKLTFIATAVNNKLKYVAAVREATSHREKFDLILCGHINLLPLAYLCHLKQKSPLGLIIHGIDAWQPKNNALLNNLVKKIDFFISVSDFTKQKFLGWTGLDADKGHILPNCIEIAKYGPGSKCTKLLERYNLSGKKVIMTLGRLVQHERYKGFDEVLDVLPELAKKIPSISYLIAGEGNDRKRLEQKAKTLGVTDRVVFSGFIPEQEKADHYRLADAYVMPSKGEGFGIVYLEALACGIPVIASSADGSREAVLNGKLGILVNPSDRVEIKNAILTALQNESREVLSGINHFSFENYSKRLHAVVVNELNRINKHTIAP